ncbi:beta family protein [Caulobacter sp. LARHSG274]
MSGVLRAFDDISYIPLLAVRPAEMMALQSLPERDKDRLLPTFRLQPWVSAHKLESALARITDAYGKRPYFVSLCDPETVASPRPVHAQLDQLRAPDDGFRAWCDFLADEERQNLIPSLQLTDVNEFDTQAARLRELGRGLMVPLEAEAFRFIRAIATRTAAATDGGRDVVFLLDWGRQTRHLLLLEAEATEYVRTILEVAPHARVALSASTFPEAFTAISEQSIYEREFFEAVKRRSDRVIFSDRGSTRAERQNGGGGAPAPRIDYARARQWNFFRSDTSDDRPSAYQLQAQKLMASPIWDGNLRLWGTQMIERTALGDESAIVSPARSTAVRVNIHLHQQLFFNAPRELYDTDEEWTD